MISLYRGLLAGFLVAGLAAVGSVPSQVAAQDKKDPKKDAKDDLRERSVGFGTSDGLTLSGYWFQGNAIDKQLPDAVMMFPAPGSKINDSWVHLARGLSEKNFSVLLFDWRGCGINGPDGVGQGSRIFENKDKFWREPFNDLFLKTRRTTLERQGLEFRTLLAAGNDRGTYRAFMMNDLLAARFYLDQQSDAKKCNTNRVWIVSEKDGAHLGLAFIAAEFQRNALFKPDTTALDTGRQVKSAGSTYAGITALSFTTSGTNMNSVANTVYNTAMSAKGTIESDTEKPMSHLQDRLAMVLMWNKKEGATNAKSISSRVGVTGTTDEMMTKFKYLKEFDIKNAKTITGVDMIDKDDTYKVREFVVKYMVEISKDKQNFGKAPTVKNADKLAYVPRFEIETFTRR